LDVNIRSANFRDFDREQRGITLEFRLGDFTHLDARVGFGDYSDK
jgi:hypothetical protein